MWSSFWRDVSQGDFSTIYGLLSSSYSERWLQEGKKFVRGEESEITLLTALKNHTLELSVLNSGSDLDQKSSYLKLDYCEEGLLTYPDLAVPLAFRRHVMDQMCG